jgi:hypothetical protein
MHLEKLGWAPALGNDFITLLERMPFPALFTLLSIWRNQPLSAIALLGHIVNRCKGENACSSIDLPL